MLDRIADLASMLSSAPLESDALGNDYDQAAVALQALTAIMVIREARSKMPRWERISNGRLVLRPDNPPTPEETALHDRNMAEIVAARQPPAAGIFNPESTTLRDECGAPIESRAKYNEVMKAKGLVEVSGYDARNDDASAQRRAIEKQQDEYNRRLAELAVEFGIKTGQIRSDGSVPAGAPVIPMPVEPNPHAIKPRQVDPERIAAMASAAPNEKPLTEAIPLEKRKRVNTDAMMNNLVIGALKRSAEGAEKSGGVMNMAS